MPATSPPIVHAAAADLGVLGAAIRARRAELGLSMVATAGAAGISRVTLHRIERGVPAVTMGAYMNAAAALGLRITACSPTSHAASTSSAYAAAVRVRDYPQLRQLAWNLSEETTLTEEEALHLYERNWRHVDQSTITESERDFIQHLADTWSGGRLLV